MKFIAIAIALLFILPSFPIAEEKLVIMVSNDNPFYTLIATPLSFHLGKKPIILFKDELEERQKRFIEMYGGNEFIVIGKKLNLEGKYFTGNASKISIEIAKKYYENVDTAIIIPYSNYSLSLIAVPIACYIDAPLLVYDNNQNEIIQFLNEKGIKKAIIIGNISIWNNEIKLQNESMIYDYIKRLKSIDYIALTNPDDIKKVEILQQKSIQKSFHVSNLKIFLAYPFNIFGSNEKNIYFNISDGMNEVKISIEGNPTIYAELYDDSNNLITYSNSMAYKKNKCYLQSICFGGTYRLHLKFYNGKIGGYFIQHGISFLNTDVKVRIKVDEISSFPYHLKISYLAPYLACSHNGMVITTHGIEKAYKNCHVSGGAWNNATMISFVNDVVNSTVSYIKKLDFHPRWLAIVGDSDEIPMYYFSPSVGDAFVGYGIPSDAPYSLNYSIAIGRIVAFDDIDASLLISRSIFYDEIIKGEWINKFTFINGEGFGETAAIFHQIPYSKFVASKGFQVSLYGDFRNYRKSLREGNAFNSSYVEYEGHGDWFWMFANIYTNYYNNVDVAYLRNHEIPPAIILTAACLMGRIDGIVLNESIALAFIHSGAVAFIGATRETGKEAKLDWIENDLLQNDTSIGEAFIHSKMMEEMPTKAARILYGDPALNPYEPKY